MEPKHFAIVLWTLLVIFYVNTDCHAGYDYDPEEDYGGCNYEMGLHHGESFMIVSFPSRPENRPARFRYEPRYSPPEECSLLFKSVGDCVLVFHTGYFERGDVDCEQQYLLFGDEYSENRICGFNRPPKQFRSHGSTLFFTHYRRNGGYMARASYIGGTVRCAKHTGATASYSTSAGYNQGNNSLGCPSQLMNCKVVLVGNAPVPFTTISVQGTFGGNPVQVGNACPAISCHLNATACFVLQNSSGSAYVNEDSQGNQTCSQPPVPDHCQSIIVPCQSMGECSGSAHYTEVGSGMVFQNITESSTCHAAPDQLCSEVIYACAT